MKQSAGRSRRSAHPSRPPQSCVADPLHHRRHPTQPDRSRQRNQGKPRSSTMHVCHKTTAPVCGRGLRPRGAAAAPPEAAGRGLLLEGAYPHISNPRCSQPRAPQPPAPMTQCMGCVVRQWAPQARTAKTKLKRWPELYRHSSLQHKALAIGTSSSSG